MVPKIFNVLIITFGSWWEGANLEVMVFFPYFCPKNTALRFWLFQIFKWTVQTIPQISGAIESLLLSQLTPDNIIYCNFGGSKHTKLCMIWIFYFLSGIMLQNSSVAKSYIYRSLIVYQYNIMHKFIQIYSVRFLILQYPNQKTICIIPPRLRLLYLNTSSWCEWNWCVVHWLDSYMIFISPVCICFFNQ